MGGRAKKKSKAKQGTAEVLNARGWLGFQTVKPWMAPVKWHWVNI